MPNRVDHTLEITGPEPELRRFLEECFTEGEKGQPCFDFDKLVPMPTAMKESKDTGGWAVDGDLRLPDWYAWRLENWGTQWNALDTEITSASNGSQALRLCFDTAWSIPWPIFEELTARFPLLTTDGEIVDMQLPFGGHIHCGGGKIEYEDQTEQIEAELEEFYARREEQDAAAPPGLEQLLSGLQ